MNEKKDCYVISIWHNASYAMDPSHMVVVEYCPVVYSCGEGLYSITGYIGSITSEYCSIILDSSFTIQKGSHPTDDDSVICDGIKDVVKNVISKTLAIVQMEVGSKLNVIVDNVEMSETMPLQLVDINKWIMRKLIVDDNATQNDKEYDPNIYFSDSNISDITEFCITMDKFNRTASAIIDMLIAMIDHIDITDTTRPIMVDMVNDIDTMVEKTILFKTMLEDKISNH